MRGGLDYDHPIWLGDGVNTTDPLTNTFSTNMNFDASERQIRVITGGMDAEYGRSLGEPSTLSPVQVETSLRVMFRCSYTGTNMQVL